MDCKLILLLFVTTVSFGQLKSFPSAVGYGQFTTGGRNGTIYHVTNLNDSGAGSLRAAVEATGPRTVVFDVAGDINLTGLQYEITSGNLTIAGETAPSPGITIRTNSLSGSSYGGVFNVFAGNIIMRYITIRHSGSLADMDCIQILGTTQISNIILDHVTVSNGTDENVSIRNTTDTTIQFCMLSNSKGSGAYLFRQDNTDHTYFGNYNSHNGYRNPLWGFGKSGENFEFINNITYGYIEGGIITYGHVGDMIGNIYKDFNGETATKAAISVDANLQSGSPSDGAFYLADNFKINNASRALYDAEATTYNKTVRQMTTSTIDTWETTQLGIESLILDNVGNSLYRDAMDAQAVADYYTGAGSYTSLSIPTKSSGSHAAGYDDDNGGLGDSMSDDVEVLLFGSDGATSDPWGFTDTNYVDLHWNGINSYPNLNKVMFYLAGELVLSGGTSEGVTSETGKKTANTILIAN